MTPDGAMTFGNAWNVSGGGRVAVSSNGGTEVGVVATALPQLPQKWADPARATPQEEQKRGDSVTSRQAPSGSHQAIP